jgi:hypothetical protein
MYSYQLGNDFEEGKPLGAMLKLNITVLTQARLIETRLKK